MYKVELYIDGQRADLFQNENIEINLSVQNIKDISKVFGDFTQSFTIPASVQNNKISIAMPLIHALLQRLVHFTRTSIYFARNTFQLVLA